MYLLNIVSLLGLNNTVLDILSIILLLIFIIGFLAFFIVLLKRKENNKGKFFFLLFIFSISHYSLLIFLVHSKFIIEYPHFFRTASPFLYGLSIAFFLYYRYYNNIQASKEDKALWLLLIPLVHFIELLPFYLQRASVKRDYLINLSYNPDQVIYSYEGWIPTSWHLFLQLTLGIILFSTIIVDILKKSSLETKKTTSILSWFKWSSILQLLCFASLLLILIIDSPKINVYGFGAFVFACIQFTVVLNLFLQPQSLYGTLPLMKKRRTFNSKSSAPVSEEEIQSYYLKIESFFNDETAFLKTDFRQNNLADSLNMSRNKLSYIVNSTYDLNFNQLLNKKRVEYLISKLKQNKDWDNLSLSGIGQEVGFKSRTTFIKAFKSNTGKTPSKFMAEMRETEY